MQQALVSIHDVMPATLDRVGQLLGLVRSHGLSRITLLVVPGLPWSNADVDELRHWHGEGCTLAGHGWTHHCNHIRGWGHRLHSWLISRDVAEHLSVSPAERIQLMRRCAEWFSDRGLTVPRLYVPPAWALGRLPAQSLNQIPFHLVETQTGVFSTTTGSRFRLPLIGFETDHWLRTCGVRCWNAVNGTLAGLLRRPFRLALHPRDLELPMANDLRRALSREIQCIDYADLPQI